MLGHIPTSCGSLDVSLQAVSLIVAGLFDVAMNRQLIQTDSTLSKDAAGDVRFSRNRRLSRHTTRDQPRLDSVLTTGASILVLKRGPSVGCEALEHWRITSWYT